MNEKREAFLAGTRLDDVHVYIADSAVSNLDTLEAHGERVDGGVVLVLDGERARSVFQRAAGIDPMRLAGQAMGTEGEVDADCTDGSCPVGEGPEHEPQFIFAFAQAQNEEVGGLYAEGDVIHAYAACSCGEYYSQKWVAQQR